MLNFVEASMRSISFTYKDSKKKFFTECIQETLHFEDDRVDKITTCESNDGLFCILELQLQLIYLLIFKFICSTVLRFFRRCASTSQGGPSRPPIQTNPPQNNAATDSTDEKMDANAGGPYSPVVYEDY